MFNQAVPFAETIVVIGGAATVLARWVPLGRRRVATLAASGIALAGLVLALAFGLRWQMYPVLLATFIAMLCAIPTIVGPRKTGRVRRAPWWLAAPGGLLCLVLVAAGAGAAWALPIPSFPVPSGQYAVGTTTFQWTDSTRGEPQTRDPFDHRTIVAQLWYPGVPNATARPAPYLGRTHREAQIVAAAAARYFGVPPFVVDSVTRAQTGSFENLPVAGGHRRFPIVLFSPGLGGVRGQNTLWAEELASRGYVVVALDHPYDSAAVVLDDGSVIRSRVSPTGSDAQDEMNAVGWTATRAADLSFALSKVDALAKGIIPTRFAGRLDVTRVAATGHSIGGAAALEAAKTDARIKAVIDLDGAVHDPSAAVFHQPVLVLAHPLPPGENDSYLPGVNRVLVLSTAPSYLLVIPGTSHLTFTDAPLYVPPLTSMAGSLGRTAGPELTASLSADFLDWALQGKANHLSALLAVHGTLTIHPGSR